MKEQPQKVDPNKGKNSKIVICSNTSSETTINSRTLVANPNIVSVCWNASGETHPSSIHNPSALILISAPSFPSRKSFINFLNVGRLFISSSNNVPSFWAHRTNILVDIVASPNDREGPMLFNTISNTLFCVCNIKFSNAVLFDNDDDDDDDD